MPDDGAEPREYALPRGGHVNVHEGEREQLMDGPSNPHDILRVLGEKELQKYLVNEIQEVYPLQGVNINDKHIEVISRQIPASTGFERYRNVRIPPDEPPRTPDEELDLEREIEYALEAGEIGGRPAAVDCCIRWSPAGAWRRHAGGRGTRACLRRACSRRRLVRS